MFRSLPREVTRSLSIQFTGTLPDPRIDANALDHFDCVAGAFGCLWHFVVRTNGVIEIGRDPRSRTSRTRNHWTRVEAIHIGVVGGFNEEGERVQSTTPEQAVAIEALMVEAATALNTPLEVHDGRSSWTRADYKTDLEIAAEQDAMFDAQEATSLDGHSTCPSLI